MIFQLIIAMRYGQYNFATNIQFFFLSLVISSLFYIVVVNAYSSPGNDFLYSPDSSPFGRHTSEWLADWWKLNLNMTAEDHPNYINQDKNIDNTKDTTNCFIGEDVKNGVLFLSIPFVSEKFPIRSCDVPTGKSIFMPLESSQCDLGIPGLVDLVSCAKAGNDGVTIILTLDNIKLDYSIDKNRVMTDFFNITMNNSMMGAYTGTYLSLSEGYTIFLKPLQPGKHTFNYKISVVNMEDPINNYHQDGIFYFNVN